MSIVNPEKTPTTNTDKTPQHRTSSGGNVMKSLLETHDFKAPAFKLQDLADDAFVVECQNLLTHFATSLLVSYFTTY